ncbi:MAG: hypothetical protein H7145_12700 [Akkermansiaceae bacterium]|nr:hypothetical protein [Armatimonadota bacterium]
MIDSQTAQAHLRDATTVHPLTAQVKRAQDLPPALRAAAFSLLGCDLDGKPFTSYRTSPGRVEAQAEAAALCDAITVPEREQLFCAFFPKLGPAMARWWSPEISPLHHVGWNPRPFRLLYNTETSRSGRLQQLQSLLSDSPHFGVGRYCEQDPIWFATYAPYLGSENSRALIGDRLGAILSTAIDRSDPSQGNAIQEVLLLSARGEHPVGTMGRHVVRALLSSSRPEGWQYLARMLAESGEDIAVRRQILDVAGEAHPAAFARLLAVIRENNLLRFPDVIKTVIGWLGVEEEGFSLAAGNTTLEQIESFLTGDVSREKAIFNSHDGATVYYALWCAAFMDVRHAVALASRQLTGSHVECRFAAAYLLSQVRLPEAETLLLGTLDDPDLRIATFAFGTIDWNTKHARTVPVGEISGSFPAVIPAVSDAERKELGREVGLLGALRGFVASIGTRVAIDKGADTPHHKTETAATAPHVSIGTFDRVTRNLLRFPVKERQLEPIVWGWTRRPAAQSRLADVLPGLLEDRPLSRLYPFLPIMSANGRWQLAEVLAGKRPRTSEGTNLLITLLSDGAANVRQRAADVLRRFPLGDVEIPRLEKIVAHRQHADIQRPVMSLLLSRTDDAVMDSAIRLLSSPEPSIRAVGFSILAQLTEKRRSPERVHDVVEGWLYGVEPHTITDEEMAQLKFLLTSRRIATLNAARKAR